MNEEEKKVHLLNLEANRLLALRKARYKMLAYQWHLQRRWRLQGRITTEQWTDWAHMYLGGLEHGSWRQWCAWQIGRATHTQG
jgi:hypothetical protein